MAKYDLRLEARRLRKEGLSVKKISEELKISKSSASIWVRDIVLTVDQLEALRSAEIRGAERGRLKSAFLQKERRLKRIADAMSWGMEQFPSLSKKEFLVAGLALYWGEGSKKSQQLEFCNSDPKMIKFLIGWLKICFGIETKELRCRVGINDTHKAREDKVKHFWSDLTDIPLNQFNKTLFKKTANKKVYDNFEEHYGTLSIKVLKPSRHFFKILGLIEGLNKAGMKLAFQDVS